MARWKVPAGEVDLEAGLLYTDVGPVPLTDLERELLGYLRVERGRVVSREELLERVWGYAPGTRSRAVDTAMQRLRAKIEPDPSAPRLLYTVRGGGYRLGEAEVPTVPTPADPRPLAFPRLDRAIGRSAEQREVSAVLHAGHRLVTLTGPPGVGKTWLARRVGTEISDQGRRRVWFADLSEVHGAAALRDAVALALELPRPLVDADRQVVEALGALGPSVGILDDAQGLEDPAAALLTAWLQRAPSAAVVVTSQRLLGLEGERRIAVEPLEGPAAVDLLRDRLQALALEPPAAPILAQAARRLDGLPLALELAAPMLEVLAPEAWLDRLLGSDLPRPGAPARHRSLDAAVGAATALVPEDVRRVLLEVAVFAGPFSIEAAGAVAEGADLIPALATLRRRSLLRHHPDGRLSLYGAVRDWARARLDPEAQARVSEAHAAFLLSRSGPADLVPYRAEVAQAVVEGPERLRAKLAQVLVGVVGAWGPPDLAPAVLERALRATGDPVVRSAVLCELADALRMAGRLDAAEARAREALESDRTSRAWTELSAALCLQGHPHPAVEYAREAVREAEEARTPDELYLALSALAPALHEIGDHAGSIAAHERAGAVAVSLGRPMHAAIAVANAGAVRAEEGLHDQALTSFDRALDAVGDRYPRFVAVVRLNRAVTLHDLGELAAADLAFDQAAAGMRAAGDRYHLCALEVRRAVLDAARGERVRAIRRLRRVQRAPELGGADRARSGCYLAVLTGDPTLLPPLDPDDDDPLRRGCAALLAGEALPADLAAGEVVTLTQLTRRRPR